MGRNSNPKLGAWDQVTLGLGWPGQMLKLESDSLGLGKEDGSSASMCEQAEIIPQPWVTIPQLWGLLMSSSWWGCTSQWGLRWWDHACPRPPPCTSTWQHSILLWYMALPLQHTWPIPSWRKKLREEFSSLLPQLLLSEVVLLTARSVL